MKMRKWIATALICILVLAMVSGCGSKTSSITDNEKGGQHYVLRIAATDESWRPKVLIEAANRLNEQLAAEGSLDTVELQWETVRDYKNSFPLWIKEDNLPEIVAAKQSIIYKYAQSGHIVDASYVANDEVYSSKIPQNIRDLGLMEGTYYGVICDTEARFVIIYKPALLELGWTEEDIAQLREEAFAGQFTTKELQALAKQVVDAGICEYGITHRPNSGADWAFTYAAFNGGTLPQNEAGQNVISRQAVINCLTYFRENVQMGLTPYNLLTDYNWNTLEGKIWPNGESFCWYGIVGTKADCMSKSGVSSEYWDENYISIPNPVWEEGDPILCGSSPYLWGLTTSSQATEKTAEYCRRILDNALDLDLQLVMSLQTAHIAITTECAESEEYKADGWMTAANDMAPYMQKYAVSPLKDGLQDMFADSNEFFSAIQEAEVKALDPDARSVEEIADELIEKVCFNMGEGNYVLVD